MGSSGNFSQCLESESSSGTGSITDDLNASNGYTRGLENNYNHYVDYAITGVPSAGTYYVKLRYYSSSAPVVGVQVNGGSTQTVNLSNSGSWNIVSTEQIFSVSLNAGSNTIRISGTGGGSCRQDKICVNNNSSFRIGVVETSQNNAGQASDELIVSLNPSNGAFYARFRLEKGQKATLQLLDINGKTLNERRITGAGDHKERMSAESVSSGSYLVVLRRATGQEVKRVVLVK